MDSELSIIKGHCQSGNCDCYINLHSDGRVFPSDFNCEQVFIGDKYGVLCKKVPKIVDGRHKVPTCSTYYSMLKLVPTETIAKENRRASQSRSYLDILEPEGIDLIIR